MALEECSNTSNYAATLLVGAFHGIPHRDINLVASPDSFELSLTYFEVSYDMLSMWCGKLDSRKLGCLYGGRVLLNLASLQPGAGCLAGW